MTTSRDDPKDERPPRLTDADEEVLAHADERFPPDAVQLGFHHLG